MNSCITVRVYLGNSWMCDSASTQNPKKEGVWGGWGRPQVSGEGELWVEIKYDSIGGF